MLRNIFTEENLIGKEVKIVKKLLIGIVIGTIILAGAIGAQAQQFWTGTIWDGLGDGSEHYVSNVMGLDWSSSGSGVAIGIGPFGNVFPPNTQFTFDYQASLVGLTDPIGNPLPFPGLNTNFEYTVVASVPEIVDSVFGMGNVFVGAFKTLQGGTFYIYNDTNQNVNANVGTGVGFDDGTLVASGTINPNQFTIFTADLNENEGIGSTILEGLVDYANPLYLDVASIIFDFRFEGTLNYPPLDSETSAFFDGRPGEGSYPTYTVQPDDLLLKVDGSSKFSVPEPSTILLLGSGLLGLGAFLRAKRKK